MSVIQNPTQIASSESVSIVLKTTSLTRAELAAYFNVSVQTISRWKKEGLPTTVNLKHTQRFDLDATRSWIASATPRGSGQPGMSRPSRRCGRPRNIDRSFKEPAND